MRRFSPSGLFIACAAALAALVLTVANPTPEGLVHLGFGDREVRAAPGQSLSKAAKHDLSALDVFNVTLVRVRDAYVDPSRIDPKNMLYSALDSVQFNIPEVLIDPYPEEERVIVHVNDQKKSFSTKAVDSPWRLSGKLKEIFRFIETHMNPGADLAQVEYAAINGMLNTLDPHSVLLDPETAREMDMNTSGKFGGLGIVVGMRNRKLTVLRPIKGTPAERAGILRADHIAKIDAELTENLTLQEAVDRMRGAPDTKVTLWIRRKGESELLRFDLDRAIIRVESVESRMLSKNVGYIRIRQFSGRTGQETREAIDTLEGKGAKGWVLDLRSNPGGLLEQAIEVSDLFIDQGTIVTTVGGREREPRRARRQDTNKKPVAVLVNTGSASASEIVAGALKNLDRALVIGSNTFGKGSVQVLYDNKDGSKLKLTIAQYLTPGDRSIQSLGIVPDIGLQRMLVPEKNDEPTDYLRLLPPSRSYREKDLRAHLTSRYATDENKPTYELPFIYEPPTRPDENLEAEGAEGIQMEEEPLGDEFVLDFEIALARDVVVRSAHGRRDEMVEVAAKILEQRQAAEEEKLVEALGKLGVDWRDAPKREEARPQLEASLSTDKSSYDAGDTVTLSGTVTNQGQGPAYRVHARVASDDMVFEDTEMVFGYIPAGESRTWKVQVKLPDAAYDRVDRLDVEFTEARGNAVAAAPVNLRVVAADRPVFAYSHQLVDESNGDGLVQIGETHHLRVTIKNTGKGTAKEPTALLRNASGDGILLKKARFELDPLAPGESKTLDFVFDVKPELREDEVVVEMTVYDANLHVSVIEKLHYPVRVPSAGPTPAKGYVQVARQEAAVLEGAAEDASRVASAPKGAVFQVTGRLGDWYRVRLDDKRPGFIASEDVRPTKSRAKQSKLTTNWQVTPPAISVEIPAYVTQDATYRLSGSATDDTHVEDVYVFVSNRDSEVENRKVFYKSNRGGGKPNELPFQAEIPLGLGTNQVTVVARENDEVKSTHTVYVYRSGDTVTAAHSERKSAGRQ
ncbi:MXAN_5808 family serine peptidase [Haliangium ochraceum]|uniref:Carboxyl-terminal protease n=1 Tax=Haliangium ochraceum (strain DSM 14365 / JCM 11303 / SMP-2) TaxID=502025 RepID=D0LKK4_HALO1|nr:MXAN_5808 family serine peptidase [Haliangium ochraceum]ACY15052.1 carboxyl-terminal protease [Haliangium ochraceum DSM 14365]